MTLPGVFRPRSDSWLLARHLVERVGPGDRVLDPFTGSGVLAIAAALAGAETTAIDISRRAVLCAWINARLNGVRLEAIRSENLLPLRDRRFDLIVANPPYLPGTTETASGSARAWEGGRDGRWFVGSLCDLAPSYLHVGGRLLLVHSSVCGEDATLRRLEGAGLEARVASRSIGPIGPLLAARAPALRRGGYQIGDREEMLVFEGTLRSRGTSDSRSTRYRYRPSIVGKTLPGSVRDDQPCMLKIDAADPFPTD